MIRKKDTVCDLKIAYIGGGSRGWAWTLMKDLANSRLSGQVALYDIDLEAAQDNAVIGNRINIEYPETAKWTYTACEKLSEALTGADFVVISILPGTFQEMRVDVHAPEKYGIYQPVGDTIGPGGVIRSLRTIPMFEEIARAVRDYCPDAWVINYTNPMSVCVRTLYETFPGIKAFGCCHEVFNTQRLICRALEEIEGIANVDRRDIRVEVTGVNHFTWLTEASYGKMDAVPIYRAYAKKHWEDAAGVAGDDNWMNSVFATRQFVKFDLFLRYGYIAAAGDRHLAEFCPPAWYTKDPDAVHDWGFNLTSVDWRENDLQDRLAKSRRLKTGEEKLTLEASGEEGVRQMEAILGLGDLVTNVNLPNMGQIPSLPRGTVVETNAIFAADSVKPVLTAKLPESLFGLIAPIVAVQDLTMQAGRERSLERAFQAFLADPHVQSLSLKDAKALFGEMVEGTKEYLTQYK